MREKKHLLQFTVVDEEVLCLECSKRMPNNEEEKDSDEDSSHCLDINNNIFTKEANSFIFSWDY